ncbi:pirin family protein [Oxalobacteraceae bacterium CAVE-383]|nr:pirin family protein [Oxalobacteraceae bacterium CAVE-383]
MYTAVRDDIADLVTYRALPTSQIDMIDPFLFLNHHGPQDYPRANRGLPFGPHPHRGFETVTFVLDGDIAHRDSAGHESIIGAQGVQWMTAGSGLVHSETSSDAFKASGGPMEVLQLWLNLPARLKMTPPRYTGLQGDRIPVLSADDGRVRIQLIAGEFKGAGRQEARAAFDTLTDVSVQTITLQAGARLHLDIPVVHNIFFYVVRGAVEVNGVQARQRSLVEFENDAEAVDINTETNADALVLLCHATPYGEPVVSHGPFVMNTREEIQAAIDDYHAGRLQ